MKVEESMKGLDYIAVARSYGLNNAKIAKRLYAKAMDITRALTGNLPQDVLESKYGEELLNNYQDLLRDSKNKQWRENVETKDKIEEGAEMKNKTKIREYVEGNMNLDELINEFDLEEEQSNPSYTQAIMKDRTVMKKKKKEYASNDGKPNTGDLDGTNGFGTSYADEGTNAYGTEDDKQMIIDAEAYPMGDSKVEERVIREKSSYFIVDILKNKTANITSDSIPARGIVSYYLTFIDGGEISIHTKNADISAKDITKGSPIATEVFTNIEDSDVFAIDTAWIMQ